MKFSTKFLKNYLNQPNNHLNMTQLKDLKRKVVRHNKKNGVPLYIQKRNERFGTFNKVKRIPKVVRFTLSPVTPLKRFQKVVKKVMSQNKTKKWREETRTITIRKPEKIQQIKMSTQHFPVYPCTRKGKVLSLEKRLEFSERIKMINSDWNYNTGVNERMDMDLDNDDDGEFEFDEWEEEEIEVDIDDVNYE